MSEKNKKKKKLDDYNSMDIEEKLEFLLQKEDLNIELIKELLKQKDNYKISTKDITKTSQGVDQIKTLKREIDYNKGKPLKIKEMAFSNYKENKNNKKNQKLYETIYDENGNQEIIYYEKDGKTILAIIEIDKDGKLEFKLEKDKKKATYNLNKINEILNDDYKSINGFDDKLSFLSYIPLMNTENIIFKTNCKSIKNIVDIIKDSKNKDEIFICDFGYEEHRVQVVINKCNVTILNTGYNFEDVKKNIKKECKGQNIKIEHISTIDQIDGNCVEASKLYTIVLAMNYKEEFKTFENFSESLNNFQKFIENILDMKGYNRTKQKKCIKKLIDLDNSKGNEEFNKNIKMLNIILKTNIELLNKHKKHFKKIDKDLRKFYTIVKDMDQKVDNNIKEDSDIINIISFGQEIEKEENEKNENKYKKFLKYVIEFFKNYKNIEEKNKNTYIKQTERLLKIIKNDIKPNKKLYSKKQKEKQKMIINIILNRKKEDVFQECIKEISSINAKELGF